MMEKILLFYNPRAGNGLFKSNLDTIVNRLQNKNRIVTAVSAADCLSVSDVIASLDDTYVKIIAAGGDGTINIVVNAMIENDCHLPLAVLPAGTANDFAHYFEIPTDLDGMLEIAAGDSFIPADIGKCNDRYFVNVAAIGSVIDVSQKTDPSLKNALGILAYYIKALTELHSLHPVEVTITTPDVKLTEKILFMVVLNGTSAGGFRKLGVQSSINDGLLDVIMFKNMKLTDLPVVGLKVLQGRHNEDDNVIYFQTPELKIEASEALSTDIDGEIGQPLPLDIKILPKRINISTRRSAYTEKIITTEMHESLNPFYAANGLEIAEDEPVSTDTLKSWVIMSEDDSIKGACTLAFRQGEYIIDGIAVSPELQGTGMGTELLRTAEAEIMSRGGACVYLVARAPEFFRSNGYKTVKREDAPEFFECFGCDQYNRTCFPEVMKHVLQS
jgi:YegS/Rv2252/BmrU family lipid kinase